MALFKTTEEIKKYIVIDVNMKFSKLSPDLTEAEEKFIKPILGKDFFDELTLAYTAATEQDPLSNELKAVLPYVQRALANYLGFLIVDVVGVQVGDLGIQQSSNQNSSPAPMAKVEKLKMKFLSSGDAAADLLLEYLEIASALDDGDPEEDRLYATWYNSDANTALSGTIVYKTAIANKYIEINDSRRLFLRLRKHIKDIEAGYVKRLICKPQFDEIITQLRAEELTADNALLVEKLEPIISKRALYLALPSLPVQITADGLFLQSSNDGVVQKLIAGVTEKQTLCTSLKGGDYGFEADEAELTAFLKDNIDDYPLIRDSACWANGGEGNDPKWKIDNDPCNKHFST